MRWLAALPKLEGLSTQLELELIPTIFKLVERL